MNLLYIFYKTCDEENFNPIFRACFTSREWSQGSLRDWVLLFKPLLSIEVISNLMDKFEAEIYILLFFFCLREFVEI